MKRANNDCNLLEKRNVTISSPSLAVEVSTIADVSSILTRISKPLNVEILLQESKHAIHAEDT